MTTSDQIQQLEQRLEERFDKRFSKMDRNFMALQKNIDERLAPLHDFMVGQQAIAGTKTSQSVGTKDLMALIVKLVAIIGAIVGIGQLK